MKFIELKPACMYICRQHDQLEFPRIYLPACNQIIDEEKQIEFYRKNKSGGSRFGQNLTANIPFNLNFINSLNICFN